MILELMMWVCTVQVSGGVVAEDLVQIQAAQAECASGYLRCLREPQDGRDLVRPVSLITTEDFIRCADRFKNRVDSGDIGQ